MRKNGNIPTVAEQRKYMVLDVNAAKRIALIWLQNAQLENSVDFGLPEVDDRYHIWRVPLLNKASKERIGEVVIDARTSLILQDKSTSVVSLEARLLGRGEKPVEKTTARSNGTYKLSTMRNTIALAACRREQSSSPPSRSPGNAPCMAQTEPTFLCSIVGTTGTEMVVA